MNRLAQSYNMRKEKSEGRRCFDDVMHKCDAMTVMGQRLSNVIKSIKRATTKHTMLLELRAESVSDDIEDALEVINKSYAEFATGPKRATSILIVGGDFNTRVSCWTTAWRHRPRRRSGREWLLSTVRWNLNTALSDPDEGHEKFWAFAAKRKIKRRYDAICS